MLVGREVFSSLDEEYEKQVNEGSDVSLNREDQRTTISSRGEYEYLVSWKGYSARLSSSWLDEAGLTPNAAEILAEFKAKVEMPPLPKKRRRR